HEFRMPMHAHAEAQIIFLLAGTVLDQRNHQSFLQEPATLIFLQAGELHATKSLPGFKSFQLSIDPKWLTRLLQHSTFVNCPSRDRHPLPIILVSKMYREFRHRDHLTPLVLEGLLLQLLAEVLRLPTERQPGPKWLKQVAELLHDRFDENLSLDFIAMQA